MTVRQDSLLRTHRCDQCGTYFATRSRRVDATLAGGQCPFCDKDHADGGPIGGSVLSLDRQGPPAPEQA